MRVIDESRSEGPYASRERYAVFPSRPERGYRYQASIRYVMIRLQLPENQVLLTVCTSQPPTE